MKIDNKKRVSGHRIIWYGFLCLFLLCIGGSFSVAQTPSSQEETKKVHLLHSDVLKYNERINRDAQILNGNVKFLHNDVYMYCDSAHFYDKTNSFEAFGNVKMEQGDTLTLTGDYLFYDGNSQIAQVRRNVVMTHNNSTLHTDSLNYDRLYQLGYFFEGGTLHDKDNVLTSEWGEYSPATKQAIFNYNVELVNPKFTLKSDTLHYETNTQIAHIVGPSNIDSGDNHIYSESGWYDTNNDFARLTDRSIITNKGMKLIGDSVVFDNKTGIGEAFVDVVYTDEQNKNMLTGDYLYYVDSIGYALATQRAVVKDYSQSDTLYMHGDTLKLFTFNIDTDSLYREVHAYKRVRTFREDVQAVSDSMTYSSKDSCITLYGDPIVWNGNQQLLGEIIKIYMNDSTINWTHVIDQALSVERIDSTHYNQVSSREMKSFFDNGEIKSNRAIGNVLAAYYPMDNDSLMIGLNYTETSEMCVYMENRKMHKIWTAPASGTIYPVTQIPNDKRYLPDFAWFDYIRPLNKDDIFEWRGKKSGTELKKVVRGEVPLQNLNDLKKKRK